MTRERSLPSPRGVVAAALLSAGVFISACSGSAATGGSGTPGTDTAEHIVPAVEAAIKAATSVHVAGTVLEGSQKLMIDASFAGSDVSGTFSEGSGSYTILETSGGTYIELSKAFLKAARLPAADCSALCGKYVNVPAADVARYTASLTMSRLVSEWIESMAPVAGDTAAVFKPATLGGRPVLQLRQGTLTIDVASTGAPYPLFLSDSAHGSLTFSEWNSVPRPAAPPASDVIGAGQFL